MGTGNTKLHCQDISKLRFWKTRPKACNLLSTLNLSKCPSSSGLIGLYNIGPPGVWPIPAVAALHIQRSEVSGAGLVQGRCQEIKTPEEKEEDEDDEEEEKEQD